MKNAPSFLRLLAVVFSLFLVEKSLAQTCGDDDWGLSSQCQSINAKGGLNGLIDFCEGQPINFNNNSDSPNIDSVIIDWGDGKCEVLPGNPPVLTHVYDFPNDTCLQDDCGIIAVTIRFGVIRRCAPDKLSFHSITTDIAIHVRPIPAFSIMPNPACVGDKIDFKNSSCENDCDPKYKWTFPGGQTATTENVLDKMFAQGSHQITLEVSNQICGAASITQTLEVLPLTVAAAALDKYLICPGETVMATNFSQNFASSNSFNWSVTGPSGGWSFVAPTNQFSKDPKFKFIFPGDYVVKLKANGCGNAVWDTVVTVKQGPVAFRKTPISDGCIDPFSIDPSPNFDVVPAGAPTVSWTFGGGAMPATFVGADAPSVTFSGIGPKTICVKIEGHQCGEPTACDTFLIQEKSVAAFSMPSKICAPAEILAPTNGSTNSSFFEWTVLKNGSPVSPSGSTFQFTSGTTKNSPSPKIKFSAEGDFVVRLSTGAAPCGSEFSQNVTVRLAPMVDLAAITTLCSDTIFNPFSLVTFAGGTADEIFWTFQNANPPTATGQNPGAVSFVGLDTFSIKVVSKNFCASDSAAFSFEIIALPQLAIDSVGVFCHGDPCKTLGASPGGGTFSGLGISNGEFCPADILPADWGKPIFLTYQIGSVGTSCFAKKTVETMVFGTAVSAGVDQTACLEDGALTLAGASPTGGKWSGDGVIDPILGIFHPDSTAGAGPFFAVTYTFFDAKGCENKASKKVKVSGPPNLAGAIDHVCVGEKLPLDSLQIAGGSTCKWNFGDGTTAAICDPTKIFSTEGTFQITLEVKSPDGCDASLSFSMDVVAPPDAVFLPSAKDTCAVLTVAFSNQSKLSKYTSHFWNFGNGGRDTTNFLTPNPTAASYDPIEKDSTYRAILVSKNGCGDATAEAFLTVHPRPIARFGAARGVICSSDTVSFNNFSGGMPDAFRWFVQGKLVSTEAQLEPQKFTTGANDSLFVILLVAENECGIDSLRDTVLVRPNPVKAFFNLPQPSICRGEPIKLTDLSTNGLFVSWDFGDGNTAVGDTVWHRFDTAGTFQIFLFVNNGCGYDTLFQWLTVHPSPVAAFDHVPSVCRNEAIFFENQSPNVAGSRWFFGDGKSDFSTVSPSHFYDSSGVFEVALVVFLQTHGCADTVFSSVEVRELPVPLLVSAAFAGCQPFSFAVEGQTTGAGNSYAWDFGDGASGVGQSAAHVFRDSGQFVLKMQVTDAFGCRADTTVFPITVHPKPINIFSVAQANLCETPAALSFKNASQNAIAFSWQFSDGQTSDKAEPTIMVDEAGFFEAILFSENQFGCRDTAVEKLRIFGTPDALFDLKMREGCAEFEVDFENQSANVNQFFWDFGDGGTSRDSSGRHRYEKAGTYAVRLWAAMDSVCFDSLFRTAFVRVWPSPTADFSAREDTTAGVLTGKFDFFDLSTADVIEWAWDFGDDLGTSDAPNPTYIYDTDSARTVRLIVWNAAGCADTAFLEVELSAFGDLFVPNALRPDGADGERVFLPVGANLEAYRLSIFSADGQCVFHSEKLERKRPSEGWNGDFRGEPLPAGIYFWKIEAKLSRGRSWRGMLFPGERRKILDGKVLLLR